jgi:hypothetical protein
MAFLMPHLEHRHHLICAKHAASKGEQLAQTSSNTRGWAYRRRLVAAK